MVYPSRYDGHDELHADLEAVVDDPTELLSATVVRDGHDEEHDDADHGQHEERQSWRGRRGKEGKAKQVGREISGGSSKKKAKKREKKVS